MASGPTRGGPTSASAYVVVVDIAASWASYPADEFAAHRLSPPDLALHAAGPTDDGYRVVEVWDSMEAFVAHGPRWVGATAALAAAPIVRSFTATHVVDRGGAPTGPELATTAAPDERARRADKETTT